MFLGLEGRSDANGRDLAIDAMKAVAERMSRRYAGRISAVRYEDRGWSIEGFAVWSEQVTGQRAFVPVRRRRRRLGGRWVGPWREVQSVPAAAHEVGSMLSRRQEAGCT